MKDIWNFFMSIDSDRMRGWTWEFFIDVFFDLPNIIVHFLLLIFIFWDDAWHIYKHRNMVFDFIMEYLKTLVYLGVFIHNKSNVAVPDSIEHNDDSLKELRPFKTKSICFTHSSASFADDAQNCDERGEKWKPQSVQYSGLHILININK